MVLWKYPANNYIRYSRGLKRVAGKKQDPLKVGRLTDRLYQQCVEKNKRLDLTDKTAHAYHAMRALRRFGIKSVQTQVPVALGKIVSRLDGLGLFLKHGKPTIVVIELKTTARILNDEAGYRALCRNKPRFDLLGLDNNEKNSHNIQADFGRIAFQRSYGSRFTGVPITSVVVIANSKEAGVREIPPVIGSDGRRLESILTTAEIEPLLRTAQFSALPTVIDGGGIIRSALRKLGYTAIKRSFRDIPPGASFVALKDGERTVIGIRPQYNEQSDAQKQEDQNLMRRIVKHNGKARDKLGILHRHKGGWIINSFPLKP